MNPRAEFYRELAAKAAKNRETGRQEFLKITGQLNKLLKNLPKNEGKK